MTNVRFRNGWGPVSLKSRLAVVGAAAVLTIAPAAAAPPAEQAVTLTATDYAFSPTEIRVVAGQPMKLTVVNRGAHTHGLRLVRSYGEVPLPMNVPAGETTTTVIDNLGDAGSYKFYCPVDEHRQRRMVGTIVVEPAK
jgi:plastocyanin